MSLVINRAHFIIFTGVSHVYYHSKKQVFLGNMDRFGWKSGVDASSRAADGHAQIAFKANESARTVELLEQVGVKRM